MHNVTLADTGWWDSLKAQVNTGYGYIAAKNDPAAYGVAAAQWVRVLALRDTNGVLLPRYDAAYFPGQPDQAAHNLGDDVAAILNGGMRAVMIDELSSATQELIARTCSYISYLGNYSHRWGVY